MLLVMVMVSGFQSPMSWLSSKVPSNVLSIVVAAAVLQSLMMFEPALSISAPLSVCSSIHCESVLRLSLYKACHRAGSHGLPDYSLPGVGI